MGSAGRRKTLGRTSFSPERIPESAYVRDVHGLPAWRRHLTRLYAEEIRAELAG